MAQMKEEYEKKIKDYQNMMANASSDGQKKIRDFFISYLLLFTVFFLEIIDI